MSGVGPFAVIRISIKKLALGAGYAHAAYSDIAPTIGINRRLAAHGGRLEGLLLADHLAADLGPLA